MTHPLLKPPGGIFVLAGLVLVMAFMIDNFMFLVWSEGQGRIVIGWGPILDATNLVQFLSQGVILFLVGVILSLLARISARLRALADAGSSIR